MKRLLLACLCLGSLGLTPLPAIAQKVKESKHGWLYSLSEGKAQARQTGKPLMVVLRCVP